jgi:signal transduction histidine kinase
MEKDKLFGLQVEEVASLRNAIIELAQKAVEKTELEKRYVSDIVKAQENERNRLAREIHDGPVQIVAALIQRIQMAALSEGRERGAQLVLAEEAAEHAVEDLRGICDSLVPPWVSLGPVRCLEETASQLARQHDVVIEADIDLPVELPQDKTLALFRIFQEGVSNAVRHGHATHIKLDVSLSASPDVTGKECCELLFMLHDNGAGFDLRAIGTEELYASGRRGIVGMRQRVESFGGNFSIVSAPGKGTTIEVRLGMEENEEPR